MDTRYEIVTEAAGEGGFGRIDKAHDKTLDRPVAIKTLDPLFKTKLSDGDVERFHREARNLAKLSHPSVPAIYDVDFQPEKEEFRIIFEWVEGHTLREHLQDRGVLSLQEARTYFSRICSALSHAHSMGIVHRDIKPANILLQPESADCYLVDFGIALNERDLERLTDGSPIGSAGYMAPEQERNEAVTRLADIYSLGIVLYECLAGVRPIVGGYKALGLHIEAIPPGVDSLVQEALSEDPRDRPQSAAEFAERLNETLRPHSSFTATLTEGSLLDIQLALSEIAPPDYESLPVGQRILILTRLRDLVSVDKESLRRAVAALVAELVRLAHDGPLSQYEIIVNFAFEYGYQKSYAQSWQGNGPTRTALNDVAVTCGRDPHSLITAGALKLANENDVASKPGWYVHDLRQLLQRLLTNPICADHDAESLGTALSDLNEKTHTSGTE
jgi:serine/threonine protein kinase